MDELADGRRVIDLRARFAARFGEDLAERLEAAIEYHVARYPMPLDRGSVPFRFVLVWRIGFGCLLDPAYRRAHGVAAPWADLAEWIRAEADLASYDGTPDLAGRALGSFDFVFGPVTEEEYEVGLEAAYAYRLASEPVAGEA